MNINLKHQHIANCHCRKVGVATWQTMLLLICNRRSRAGVFAALMAGLFQTSAFSLDFTISQQLPDRCNLASFEQANSINQLFNNYSIELVNDRQNNRVARRLGHFFTLDTHLQAALAEAFTNGFIHQLTIEVVSQQELYQVQSEAQNLFEGSTRHATIRLADQYVIGDYETTCALSLAGIENEFSEVVLRARYYATYGIDLQPSVYQESATLAFSSLVSLLLQGESFTSAEDVRSILQEVLGRSQRSYATRTELPLSASEQEATFVAAWLNQRLQAFLPTPFPDGQVEFVVDRSAGRGNVIRPIVVSPP
jgi:hypothetical protein